MGKLKSFLAVAVVAMLAVALVAPQAGAARRDADDDFLTGGGFIDLGKSPTLLSLMGVENPSLDSEFGKVHFSLRLECEDNDNPNKLQVWDDDDRAQLVEGFHFCDDGDGDGMEDRIQGSGMFDCDGAMVMGDYAASDDAPLPSQSPGPFGGPFAHSGADGFQNGDEDMVDFNIGDGLGCDIEASGELDGGNIQFHQGQS